MTDRTSKDEGEKNWHRYERERETERETTKRVTQIRIKNAG